MSLLDHYHAPLHPQRTWESFHSRWANSLADELHRVLPKRFFAEVQVHLGNEIETDVAEFERLAADPAQGEANGSAGGVALETWAPPAATQVLPAVFPDDVEVQVRDTREDAQLVAVVELVSPRNKDRAESRRAFAAKCLAYLQRGLGVMVLDIVTSRRANLHNELIQTMNLAPAFEMPRGHGPNRRVACGAGVEFPAAAVAAGAARLPGAAVGPGRRLPRRLHAQPAVTICKTRATAATFQLGFSTNCTPRA